MKRLAPVTKRCLAWLGRAVLTLGVLTGCGGGARVPAPVANLHPASLPTFVNAGADVQVLAGASACLDGTSSYHPQGQTYFLNWTQTAGDAVHLNDVASHTPCFVAPLSEQTLTFKVTANDDAWLTTDTVNVQVRVHPSATAPIVRAGADRLLTGSEKLTPAASDSLINDANVIPTWESIAVQPAPGAPSDGVLVSAGLFRLSGHTANGLDSIPDYLVLWPYDASLAGYHAPMANVVGPQDGNAQAQVLLDATGSTDSGNGSALQWRWVQTCGNGNFADPGNVAKAALMLAAQPQTQCFRVTVRDTLLESAPADLTIAVQAPPGHVVPVVTPPAQLNTHAGNAVVLSADPNGTNPNTLLYAWQQTTGAALNTLSAPDNGPLLSFTAPTTVPYLLAFSVSASDGVVAGSTAVSVVNVVPNANNVAPTVALCTDTPSPAAGSTVHLYGSAIDPEQDALDPNHPWSATPTQAVTDAPVGTRPSACPLPPSSSGAPTQAFVGTLTAPASGSQVSVTLTVCDALHACGTASVNLSIP